MSTARDRFLIDTSVWIRIYRRRPDPELEGRITPLLEQQLALTNPAIVSELLVGCKTEEEYGETLADFHGLTELRVRDETWHLASSLGFQLRKRGMIVSLPDLIIAASAMEHDAVLVHADSDFDRIAASSSLRVESYAADASI